MGVTRRIDLSDLLSTVAPKLANVAIGPRAIRCYLVCKVAAKGVSKHEDSVVGSFKDFKVKAVSNLVVELVFIDLGHHVAADGRVVRVAHNLTAKENLDERVSKAHANRVNKHIARCRLHGLHTSLVVRDKLPEKRERWVILSTHLLV